MRPPPPPLSAADRPHPMRPGTAVAFGLAGILLAAVVLCLSWYSSHAASGGAQEAPTAVPRPTAQVVVPGDPAAAPGDSVPTRLDARS